MVCSMRSLVTDMGIAGSQSLGIYTPTVRRKAYDDNANVLMPKAEYKEGILSLEQEDERLDANPQQSRSGKFVQFCRTYHLTLFADRIFYLYTFSWLLFAAAFFSATAFIIPYGKEGKETI